MGFLSINGQVLSYNQYAKKVESYKMKGLEEFVRLFNAHKDVRKEREDLKWGEEIEYALFKFDSPQQERLYLGLVKDLIINFNDVSGGKEVVLHPEFGQWMVEAVPGAPYESIENPQTVLSVRSKLSNRRRILNPYFKQHGLYLASMASPPHLGTENHIEQEEEDKTCPPSLNLCKKENCGSGCSNEFSCSQFVFDKTCNPHPRFRYLVRSIRERRGEKVNIQIPLYQDKNTDMTSISKEEPYPGQIYMDAMHFGMGCSCLQVTFEAQTLNHSRYLYDQLLPFGPILAALSASAPIYKGKLADIDMRWKVIQQSVDCRNKEERDPQSSKYIPKSRYSSANYYLSKHEFVNHEKHNDSQQIPVDPIYVAKLKNEGIDEVLSNHVASLFARDPIPAYSNELEDKVDLETVEHFENIQSTNWNSMRLKPPPSMDSKIGWRVEFRSMDIQLTDFENSAMIVLLLMINNVINNFDVDFITPISKVDENFERAHNVDALVSEKFWVKTKGSLKSSIEELELNCLQETDFLQTKFERENLKQEELYEELSLLEILKGTDNFIGLYPLFEKYMDLNEWTQMQRGQIRTYLTFIEKRASGEIPSGARMMRNFVDQHPEYKQDSIVNDKVGTDLMKYIIDLNESQQKRAEFLHGDWETRRD